MVWACYMRREKLQVIRMAMEMNVEDMRITDVCVDDVEDHVNWKFKHGLEKEKINN